jgi:TetR/AcrR family transcriptional repressor of mexCD-oprJ operon
MRSDASRNHEAILTSAIAVLARSPQASMRDIAATSGTGRTTLYRHFPDRQALIDALYARVLAEADEITARIPSADGSADGSADPVRVVADLCVELAGLGDRYRFLEQHVPGRSTREAEQALERGTPLTDYIDAAQRRGRIRDDLDSGWLFEVLVALITQVATRTRTDLAARGALLRATVCSILAPPSS